MDHTHTPDPATIRFAYVSGYTAVFDVWCDECGLSGSFAVDLDTDIMWD